MDVDGAGGAGTGKLNIDPRLASINQLSEKLKIFGA